MTCDSFPTKDNQGHKEKPRNSLEGQTIQIKADLAQPGEEGPAEDKAISLAGVNLKGSRAVTSPCGGHLLTPACTRGSAKQSGPRL